jgi:hypothetical protein
MLPKLDRARSATDLQKRARDFNQSRLAAACDESVLHRPYRYSASRLSGAAAFIGFAAAFGPLLIGARVSIKPV